MSVEVKHVVPNFESVEALQEALQSKANFDPVDLYPRDGTRLLGEIEAHCAELVGVEDRELLICTSGMAAVVTAIEAVRTGCATIACGEQSYAQTASYLQNTLARRGNKLVFFDSGDISSIDKTISKHRPDIVISETVCNGPDVPVLDIDKLLGLESLQNTNPYLILDNTLPLSTTEPLAEALDTHNKALVVESGTKSYTFNRETAGHIYTKNPAILEQLRQYRRTTGVTPNVAAIENIASLLPSKAEFDKRNLQVFDTTSKLALACFGASNPNVLISHPALPNHLNNIGATKRWALGNTPVFFLQCIDTDDQFAVTRKLWAHPDIREECELGQSFAFDKTRILPDSQFPAVRIAGGANQPSTELLQAFEEVLSS